MSVPVRKRPTRKAASTAAQASTTPPNRIAPPVPNPPEAKPMMVGGSFPETVSVVSRTTATLHLVTGQVDDDATEKRLTVLLPFAELRLGGGDFRAMRGLKEDDDLPTLFSATMSLENMAFVLLDLMSDLKRLCTETAALGEATWRSTRPGWRTSATSWRTWNGRPARAG